MAYTLKMHHNIIGLPMSKALYESFAKLDGKSNCNDHPNCPEGCVRDGFRVFEIYSGISSDKEATFHMKVETRICRSLGIEAACAASDAVRLHQHQSELDCAHHLEFVILSWMEPMMIGTNQNHFELHGSISHLPHKDVNGEEGSLDTGFSIDFDVVVNRKSIADNDETKKEERQCFMHMIDGFNKAVRMTQFNHLHVQDRE
jgi:hypothetical protein